MLVLVGFVVPSESLGQTLVGTVLEDGRAAPVEGVAVSLVTRSGERRAAATSDSLGRFELTPPEFGEYVVEAVRLGYETTRSPLFALKVEGRVPFEVMMRPLPIGLGGLEVSVEREAAEYLGLYGLSPGQLGQRWIDRSAIDRMPVPTSPHQLVRWRAIPGVQVIPQGTGPPTLCVMFRPWRSCATVYLNGARISSEEAAQIGPDDLEAIAVLEPFEATTFFGTGAGHGVVLLWLRRGNE